MLKPEFGRVESSRVEKPWGYELRWAITDRYAGKVLHVNKGEALSLQYHERKDEYLYVFIGAEHGLGGWTASFPLEQSVTPSTRAPHEHASAVER